MATTNWFFDGRPSYYEFREFYEIDKTTGKKVAGTERTQRRLVRGFSRHRLVTLTADGTFDDGQIGDTDGGLNVYAYKSSYKLTASTIKVGAVEKWVCTQDEPEPSDDGCPWYSQRQTWETRAPYDDWSWPMADGSEEAL